MIPPHRATIDPQKKIWVSIWVEKCPPGSFNAYWWWFKPELAAAEPRWSSECVERLPELGRPEMVQCTSSSLLLLLPSYQDQQVSVSQLDDILQSRFEKAGQPHQPANKMLYDDLLKCKHISRKHAQTSWQGIEHKSLENTVHRTLKYNLDNSPTTKNLF